MSSEYDYEAIESMQTGWRVDREELDRLRRINADLLAALKVASAALSRWADEPDESGKSVRQVVREAIAKAEGKTDD